MASIFPDEWLDRALNIFPKNGTNISTLYIGLFTSSTPSTVPARSATGGANPSGWTEATGTNYARVAIQASSWGANVTSGTGRKTTASEVTFATAGTGGWGTVNGFFLATNASSSAGDTLVYFANFDDLTAETINANATLKITPSIQINGA